MEINVSCPAAPQLGDRALSALRKTRLAPAAPTGLRQKGGGPARYQERRRDGRIQVTPADARRSIHKHDQRQPVPKCRSREPFQRRNSVSTPPQQRDMCDPADSRQYRDDWFAIRSRAPTCRDGVCGAASTDELKQEGTDELGCHAVGRDVACANGRQISRSGSQKCHPDDSHHGSPIYARHANALATCAARHAKGHRDAETRWRSHSSQTRNPLVLTVARTQECAHFPSYPVRLSRVTSLWGPLGWGLLPRNDDILLEP